MGEKKILNLSINKIQAPIRVLFISSTPFIGGAEINLISLLSSLDPNKIAPIVCYNTSSNMKQYSVSDRFKFIPFDFPAFKKINFFKILVSMFKLTWLILNFRIQLVYINSLFEEKIILILCRLLKMPSILHIHIHEDNKSLLWMKVNSANMILFPSNSTMQSVQNSSPWIDKNKCNFVHNAVDMTYYYKRDVSTLKKELKLNEDYGIPIIGIIGRLREDKGQHIFLQMASQLTKMGVKAEYIIAGAGNDQNDKYEKYLRNMAENFGIIHNVKFLGFRTDIPDIMSLCDLLIVPSLKEPFGRVVIEAMSCETPVVASSVDGILEIFKNGEGGLFFQPGSVNDLCDKVKYFIDNPEWWNRQRELAWQLCHNRFRQEIHTQKIEKHIYDVLRNQ